MEHLNHDDIVYQTVHSHWANNVDTAKTHPKGHTEKIQRDEFNTCGLEREADRLVFTANGKPTFTYPSVAEKGPEQWPFDRPFYLILSMQIGGDWVGKPGPNDYPAGMEIDWVRVYQRLPSKPWPISRRPVVDPSEFFTCPCAFSWWGMGHRPYDSAAPCSTSLKSSSPFKNPEFWAVCWKKKSSLPAATR